MAACCRSSVSRILAAAVDLAQALLDGGVTAFELTMTSPGALDALSLLRARVPAFAQGVAALGMGSVLNRKMAAEAIASGAQFVVAPALDLPTVTYCARLGVPGHAGRVHADRNPSPRGWPARLW